MQQQVTVESELVIPVPQVVSVVALKLQGPTEDINVTVVVAVAVVVVFVKLGQATTGV